MDGHLFRGLGRWYFQGVRESMGFRCIRRYLHPRIVCLDEATCVFGVECPEGFLITVVAVEGTGNKSFGPNMIGFDA